MATTIECPRCHQSCEIPEGTLSDVLRCGSCHYNFTVPAKTDDTGAAMSSRPALANEPGPGEAAVKDPPGNVGPYVLKRRLGAGTMGEVWLAYDPNLERDIAVKILPSAFTDDPQRLKRFLREARLAAKLDHPHTVPIYQWGMEGNRAYIAMQYVGGGSLEEATRDGARLEWREATRTICEAASGLAAAHHQGLIHRDVKPANLMRTTDGATKVVDFGLARAQVSNTHLTQLGMRLGTPAYMAPEQWKGQEADARSDLYALVCTYFEILTGRLPFDAATLAALGYQHCVEPLPDPRQFVPGLPEGVCRILVKGMQKDPAHRHQSAAELVAELRAVLAMPEGAAAPDVPWQQLTASPGQESRRPEAHVPGRPRDDHSPRWQKGAGRTARPGESVSGRGRGGKRLAVALLGAAGVLALGVLLYVRTATGTVKIELSDAAAEVTVKIDGDAIDIVGLKEPLRLKVGEHDLIVESPQYRTVTKSFTVRRGQEEILRVTLETIPKLAAPPPPAPPGPVPPVPGKADIAPDSRKPTVEVPKTGVPSEAGDAKPKAPSPEPAAKPAIKEPREETPVAVRAEFTDSAPGKPGHLFITAAVKPGWHIFSITQPSGGPNATQIQVSPPPGVGITGKFCPLIAPKTGKEEAFGDLPIETHQGTVTWYAPIEVAGGVDAAGLKIRGQLSAQADNDVMGVCRPEEIPFTATLGRGYPIPVETPNITAAPAPAITDSIGMKMVLIPAGEFLMGSSDGDSDEKPPHKVRITKPFYLGQHEVTVGQFRQFITGSGYTAAGDTWKTAFPSQTDDHPVVNVSWHDAKAFCDWLSKKEGKEYRLPTEAEWEYASRAGSTTKYCFGDDEAGLGEYAWYDRNSGGQTHPVGQKKPNALRLYDMHGNAWEWCADWYDSDSYAGSPADDPKGPSSAATRVLRGGSWFSLATNTRSAYRGGRRPDIRDRSNGFRAARTIDAAPRTNGEEPAVAKPTPVAPSPPKIPKAPKAPATVSPFEAPEEPRPRGVEPRRRSPPPKAPEEETNPFGSAPTAPSK